MHVTSRLAELDGLAVAVVLRVGAFALLLSRPPVTELDGQLVPLVLLVVAFAAFPVPLPEPEAFAAALCVSVVEGAASCTISASV